MGVCLDKEYRKSTDAAATTGATGDHNAAVVGDHDHHKSGKKYFRKRSLKAKDVLSVKSPSDDKHPEQIVGFETNGVNNGAMEDGDGSVRDVTVAANEVHTVSEILVDRMASNSDLYVGSESRFLPATKMPSIPELTKPAPEFTGTAVVNGVFKEIKLSDYKGKYVVLFFYPLDFTFVCPTEIISFSDKVGEFKDINCELIACSTDSQYSHFAWVNTPRKQGGLGNLNIPLLADKTGKIARDYGCYKEDEGIAFRGLYIIDDKGVLRQITINDLPVGRSVEETLRLVQAFQYTDKHGEVCPANWKPGAKTMKPDPTGSLEYFEKEK